MMALQSLQDSSARDVACPQVYISKIARGTPLNLGVRRTKPGQRDYGHLSPKGNPFSGTFCRQERLYTLKKIYEIMQYTIVFEPNEEGGFTARCVEIPGTICQGADKGEALARLKVAIGRMQQAWQADLHRTIQSLSSDIIRIDVADAA